MLFMFYVVKNNVSKQAHQNNPQARTKRESKV